jgi:hypothetical protein
VPLFCLLLFPNEKCLSHFHGHNQQTICCCINKRQEQACILRRILFDENFGMVCLFSNGKTSAPFSPARLDYQAATLRFHAYQKTMGALSFSNRRLICSFHDSYTPVSKEPVITIFTNNYVKLILTGLCKTPLWITFYFACRLVGELTFSDLRFCYV